MFLTSIMLHEINIRGGTKPEKLHVVFYPRRIPNQIYRLMDSDYTEVFKLTAFRYIMYSQMHSRIHSLSQHELLFLLVVVNNVIRQTSIIYSN